VEQYTVYFNPSDYPGEYVVRRFVISGMNILQDKDIWARRQTLEEARKTIPRTQALMARHPSDDPVIVEVWI